MEYSEHQGDWASLERKFDVSLDTAHPGKSLGLAPEEAARCVHLRVSPDHDTLHFQTCSCSCFML